MAAPQSQSQYRCIASRSVFFGGSRPICYVKWQFKGGVATMVSHIALATMLSKCIVKLLFLHSIDKMMTDPWKAHGHPFPASWVFGFRGGFLLVAFFPGFFGPFALEKQAGKNPPKHPLKIKGSFWPKSTQGKFGLDKGKSSLYSSHFKPWGQDGTSSLKMVWGLMMVVAPIINQEGFAGTNKQSLLWPFAW